MKPVKVMIADDHTLLRNAWKLLLKQYPEYQVMAEASNGDQVLSLFEQQTANLVLMDLDMPVKNGIETTRILTEKFPFTKVIIVSMYSDNTYVKKVFTSGAKGYITKNSTEEELLVALKTVREGGKYLATDLQTCFIENAISQSTGSSLELVLTKREKEIVKLIAEGYPSKKIADTLFLSLKTVECHRMNVYKKLNVKNVIGLMKVMKGKLD